LMISDLEMNMNLPELHSDTFVSWGFDPWYYNRHYFNTSTSRDQLEHMCKAVPCIEM
jgi:hypothetical protein